MEAFVIAELKKVLQVKTNEHIWHTFCNRWLTPFALALLLLLLLCRTWHRRNSRSVCRFSVAPNWASPSPATRSWSIWPSNNRKSTSTSIHCWWTTNWSSVIFNVLRMHCPIFRYVQFTWQQLSNKEINYRYFIVVTFCLQTQIEATPFVKFACVKFFPLTTWKLIGATEAASQDLLHLRLLKVFAEMCNNCASLEKSDVHIEAVYNVLKVQFIQTPHFWPYPNCDY